MSGASPASKASPDALKDLLGADAVRPAWRRALPWLLLLVLLLFVAWGGRTWWASREAQAAPVYVTEAVKRGNLSVSVNANGTLQPTRSVNVGSELSGTVARVLVDVNDPVKKGQVLVELDTSKLVDQIARSRAALASSQAAVAQAVATSKEAEASLGRLEQVRQLSGGKVPSQTELDAARAALDRARADEQSARAAVDGAKATLSTDQTNLSKASIRSPIDGVVLTRSVDPGNAVAASLQAVTLFTLAEDLSKLQLQVNVDEADVGAVQVGQKAGFTVSTWPNRTYPATITRVAYGSTKTDNVVTYVTWLDVDNADLSLRPGMTASATITSTERKDVLLVPNTALRFTPATLAAAPADSPKPGGGPGTASAGGDARGRPSGNANILSRLMPRPPTTQPTPRATANRPGVRQVWLLNGGRPEAASVHVGATDGRWTEVDGDRLQAGIAVIVDQRATVAK